MTDYRRLSLAIAVTECRRRNKARAVEFKGGKCQRCGFTGPPVAFDFHHLDPTQKDFNISVPSVKSFARLQEELKKTILLCANCHRIAHEELFLRSFAVRKERAAELRKVHPRGRPPVIKWPPDDVLLALIVATSRPQVQKELGCTKNALWKHLQIIKSR